ncbi:MAG TPA: heparan-alpha-glucosaminide N-acetyltransferase domain-containing protein, partial [Chryseolinea sp.]|nr:heparan-alpha-glucosaminide N-acetyltransferase domain-containing protein [Chryseolinea sp.]
MPETLVKRPIVLSIPAPIEKKRIRSLDILRGAIMLLMALDHVRDFFHIHAFDSDPTDLATTTPVLFFTRWITHFCAPVFIFLSGLSAFLSGQTKTRKVLSAHLIKRGLFLVLLECSVITFSLSFNPKYDMFFLQVIWAIGWSMVILGLLVRTSMTWIVIVGTAILLGHNIMDYPPLHQLVRENIAVNVLLTARFTAYHVGDSTVLAMYPILPWTALMLLGYGCGYFFQRKISGKARRKILLGTGVACLVAFVVLRLFNGYGDPVSWSAQKNILFTAMSFLNVTKYP